MFQNHFSCYRYQAICIIVLSVPSCLTKVCVVLLPNIFLLNIYKYLEWRCILLNTCNGSNSIMLKTIQSENFFQRTNKSTKKEQQILQQMQIVNGNCITSFFKVDSLVLFGTPSFSKTITAAFFLFCVKGFPADSRNSNGNKLCPSFSRHISLLIRSRICTDFALYGKETVGISVPFHTQVER